LDHHVPKSGLARKIEDQRPEGDDDRHRDDELHHDDAVHLPPFAHEIHGFGTGRNARALSRSSSSFGGGGASTLCPLAIATSICFTTSIASASSPVIGVFPRKRSPNCAASIGFTCSCIELPLFASVMASRPRVFRRAASCQVRAVAAAQRA